MDDTGHWAGWPYMFGFCIVCGHSTAFFAKPGAPLRESLVCGYCATTSRYRSIARGVLNVLADLGVAAESIAALSHCSLARRVAIYDTQTPFSYRPLSAYPLPDLFARARWIDVECSRYLPRRALGERLSEGVTNQNLEQLTFTDSLFDIVIASDVVEHVRLDMRAFGEIARVLRPGGALLMTVPHTRSQHESIQKVIVHDPDDPDLDEVIGIPELHGSAEPEERDGVLSYRTYGTELDERLRALGFEVDYDCTSRTALGIVDTELFTCRLSGA